MIKADLTQRDLILCDALGVTPGTSGNGEVSEDAEQLRLRMEADGEKPEDVAIAYTYYAEKAQRSERENNLPEVGTQPSLIDLNNVGMYLKTDQDARAVFPDLADPLWKVRLVDYARQTGLSVLVLDNLSTLCPSLEDENQAAEWAPLNDLIVSLKHAGVATVVVHHAGKSGNYRGSTNMLTTLETVVNLKAIEATAKTSGDARFLVEVEKQRSHGVPAIKGKVLRLAEGRWLVEPDEQGDVERLWRMIQTYNYTSQQNLGDAAKMSQSKVSKTLKRAYITGVTSKEAVDGYFKKARDLRDDTCVFEGDAEVTLDI